MLTSVGTNLLSEQVLVDILQRKRLIIRIMQKMEIRRAGVPE